jgi:hypothetical protein
MGKALEIRDDLSAEALRHAARREKDGRAAARTYAIAHALDGLSREAAAWLAGHGSSGTARRGDVLQCPRTFRVLRPAEGTAAPAAEFDGRARTRGGDPARAGAFCGRLLRLDASRPLPMAGGATRQDLPPVEHDASAATARLLAPESATVSPQAGRGGAGGLQNVWPAPAASTDWLTT